MIAGILGLFKIIMSLASYLAVGAVAGFLARFLPVIPAMCVGAIMFAATAYWVASSDDSALRAQNKALAAKADELRMTTQALLNTLQEQAKAAEHNEAVMHDLHERLADMDENPECAIPKGIVDELNRIK